MSTSYLADYRLDGKLAVITGGGQGIGEACAHTLVEAGARVLLVGRNEENLKSVSDSLQNNFGSDYFKADLTSDEDISKLFEYVRSRYGTAHILINNAAIGQWKPALDITDSDWDTMIKTNLTSVFKLSQKFGSLMVNQGYGKIVNISSISGIIVNSEHAHVHYGTTKAGVIHMTKSLAAEWAKNGVRVNCITPGYTATKMLTDLLNKPEGKAIASRIGELTPMREMAQPKDIAHGVLFFSAPASDYITGQILSIDGGYTLW